MEGTQKNKNTKAVVWAVILVLIVLAAGWYIYQSSKMAGKSAPTVSANLNSASTTVSSQTSTGASGVGISYTGSSTPIIKIVSSVPSDIPSLSRPITFPAGMSPATESALESQITSLEASLAQDPSNFADWMQLGTDRKVAEDYEGAAQAWAYASELNPTDYVSFGNLADLYGYYLHDNAQAANYYVAAIKNGPKQEYLYLNAAYFYQQVENNLTAAIAVAQQGLQANPGNQDLANLLKSLQGSASPQ